MSDVLMDRAVMNEANLKNAVLQRAVLTRSDLTGANIEVSTLLVWDNVVLSLGRESMQAGQGGGEVVAEA